MMVEDSFVTVERNLTIQRASEWTAVDFSRLAPRQLLFKEKLAVTNDKGGSFAPTKHGVLVRLIFLKVRL